MARAAGKAEGLTLEVQSFLKELVKTYQSAKSYRDRGRVTLIQTSGRVKTTTEMPMELAFRRPNYLMLDAGQHSVASDGKSLYFTLSAIGQFTAGAAPANLDRQHLQAGTILGSVDEGHPELTDLLLRDDAYSAWIRHIAKIGWKTNSAGEPVLTYETTQGTKFGLSVDTNRMVIVRIVAQFSSSGATAIPGAAALDHNANQLIRLIYELSPVEFDSKIEDVQFAFKPPPGFKQVESFAFGGPGMPVGVGGQEATTTEGAHLIGKPFPPFQGHDLADNPIDLNDLRGKVVLLFFWSLGGGQYTLLSIPIVQQVADHFKHRKDLLVLGICPDTGRLDTTRDLLKRKNATFRTMLDGDRQLQSQLRLGGEPTFIIIGRDGLVKWAKLGAPPTLKDELTAEIDNSLAKSRK